MLLGKGKNYKIIFIYITILIFITSTSNKNLVNKNFFNRKLEFNILGLPKEDTKNLMYELEKLNYETIFKLNKIELSNLIRSNNRVLNFLIKKKYPNKVNISIQEAEIVGKILRDNNLNMLLSNGKTINQIDLYEQKIPFFYGDFNTNEFVNFYNILKSVNLKIENVNSFYFFPSKRWDIKFKNGLIVKLPINQTKEALIDAIKISNDEKFNNKKIIDLRIKGLVILNG